MAGNIKGLTVEIGGDTTKLGQALENVNQKSRDLSSELGQVNRLLKMDPGNTELVAQKQKILADAVQNTRDKLDTLKEAERQVQEQFERGEVSEAQYRALQREIVATEQKLKGYENAAQEVADGNDSIARSAKEATEESEDLNDTLDKFASGGLKALAGVLTAAVGGLVAAAEASREYRTAMGKLDTAFTENGFSAEAAASAYTDMVGILGETDQAVEASNHLALLTENEKDLATWTGDILPGVFATFGDSLPLEGLTEAVNHTAKLGEVQGPLADALEWMGITTDEFNESLAKCNTEQERQQLIMSTMTGLYGEASAAYKETNADVIAANEANAAWMESMAQVGAVVEPLITEVKTIGAELLSQLVPVIEKIIENLPVVLTLVAGLSAALVAFKITALGGIGAVVTRIQTAFATLWTTMLTNPIGLIIIAVTALVAGFVYLWNNCEGFREFWINLWEKIKAAASSVVDWFKTVPERISSAINGAIERVREWGNKLVEVVKKAATLWLNTMYTIYVKVPSKIWSAISGAITKVTQWGTKMKTKATTAATNMVSAITTKLAQLPGKVMSIGGDLVRGLWNGVNNKLSWLKGKISSFTQSVLGSIKDFFGVHSPARSSGNLKTTDWIGEMLNEGLAVGLLGSTSTPVKAMQKVTGAVLGTAAKANLEGINVGRSLDYNFGQASAPDLISSKLDKILDAIDKGHILVLDGDALVGATVNKFDKALGQRRALAVRGAL